MKGGGQVQGHNNYISSSFYNLHSLYSDLSGHLHACRLAPADPLLSLPFRHSLMGVLIKIQLRPVLCSVESHYRCISNRHTLFISGTFHTDIQVSILSPSLPRALTQGFVEPRPPAGIRGDNSRTLRWVLFWLLLR